MNRHSLSFTPLREGFAQGEIALATFAMRWGGDGAAGQRGEKCPPLQGEGWGEDGDRTGRRATEL